MKLYQSAFAVLLVAATAAAPCAAQHAAPTPQFLPIDTCAGCFAYLVFAPLPEAEPGAMRGEAVPAATASAAGEPGGGSWEQTAGLAVTSRR
jgi:hypothetical protein